MNIAIAIAKWLLTQEHISAATPVTVQVSGRTYSAPSIPLGTMGLRKNGFTWSEKCRRCITEGGFAIGPMTSPRIHGIFWHGFGRGQLAPNGSKSILSERTSSWLSGRQLRPGQRISAKGNPIAEFR